MDDYSNRLAAAVADRHRIERELGAGGMATVYLAHDLNALHGPEATAHCRRRAVASDLLVQATTRSGIS